MIKITQKPWEILQIQENESKNFDKVKTSFTKLMRKNTQKRYARIKLNWAYDELCHTIFKAEKQDIVYYYVLFGEYDKIKTLLADKMNKNKILNYRDKAGYPLLYIAVRSGHYDIVELILKSGCSLSFENDKSTPMHCAAYYGHTQLIPLLLLYGIPIRIKNKFGDLPIQEASSQEIKKMLLNSEKDILGELCEQLICSKICVDLLNIYQNKQVVIKKLIHKNYQDVKFKQQIYINAFHGTKFSSLPSIAKLGLKKPGEIVDGRKLEIREGHIQRQTEFRQEKNWGNAVFTTPSIYYACHAAYATGFISGNSIWLPVLQVKLLKNTFSASQHTVGTYQFQANQPINLQYRSQKSQNVSVVALIFIKKSYIDKNRNYLQITKQLLESSQQISYKQQSQLSSDRMTQKTQANEFQIKYLLEQLQKDKITPFCNKLIQAKICLQSLNIFEGKEIILIKLIHKNYASKQLNNYDNSFHGTRFQVFQSIAKNGLRRPGDIVDGKILQALQNRDERKKQMPQGQGWEKAVFTSPSIYYAAHPVYAKQFISGGAAWLPIVQVKLKKQSYKSYLHTLNHYISAKDEPKYVESRTSNLQDVIVVSLMFLKKSYLESNKNFKSCLSKILQSPQQKSYYTKYIKK